MMLPRIAMPTSAPCKLPASLVAVLLVALALLYGAPTPAPPKEVESCASAESSATRLAPVELLGSSPTVPEFGLELEAAKGPPAEAWEACPTIRAMRTSPPKLKTESCRPALTDKFSAETVPDQVPTEESALDGLLHSGELELELQSSALPKWLQECCCALVDCRFTVINPAAEWVAPGLVLIVARGVHGLTNHSEYGPTAGTIPKARNGTHAVAAAGASYIGSGAAPRLASRALPHPPQVLGFAAIRNSLIAGFATTDKAGKLSVDKASVRVISGPAHAVRNSHESNGA